ncbi:MAG: hypothetical protein KC646_16850 [Candidatus Cloacimonetes bacterium]|nr:hypothetical protein [Candidatus Cloacimonadota bacterium]
MKKFIGVVFVLLVVSLGVAYISYEAVILKKVNEGLNDSFKTNAHLDNLKVDLFDSSVKLNGLTVENPSNFTNKNFIDLNQLDIKMPLFEQSETRLNVDHLNLDHLTIELAFEQSGINGNVLKDTDTPKKEDKLYPEVMFKQIKISNLKLLVNFKGKISKLDVPDLVLNDLLIQKDPAPPIKNAVKQILHKIKDHCKKAYVEKYRSQIHQVIEDKTKEKIDEIKGKIGDKLKGFLKF